jgi:(2Fe-2S) ferredoxin
MTKKIIACLEICGGKDCARAGAKQIVRAAHSAVQACGLDGVVRVVVGKCQDRCDDGPNMVVQPRYVEYSYLNPEAIQQIVEEHVLEGRPVEEYLHQGKKKRR